MAYSHPPPSLRARVRFHRVCIGKDNGTLPYSRNGKPMLGRTASYRSLLRHAQLTHAPAYLKIDVEGAEYAIFEDMLSSGDRKLLPEQIGLELHPGLPTGGSAGRYIFGAADPVTVGRFIDDLWRRGGYFVADRVDNVIGRDCTEVLLVKRALVEQESDRFVAGPRMTSAFGATAAELGQLAADRFLRGGGHNQQYLTQRAKVPKAKPRRGRPGQVGAA